MIGAFYNEIDPDAVATLHELMRCDLIAPGHVDSRSIKEVQPNDLDGFAQCHFFAGAGIWSVAARLAGWPDTRPLWTGSCPCQPFSVAGKGGGADDPRHLWPDLFRLWRAKRPAVLVGEQVAGTAGYAWFDGIAADMAGEGVAARAVDIPACAVDAPHIRQRLYWAALDDAEGERRGEGRTQSEFRSGRPAIASADAQDVGLADANGGGRDRRAETPERQAVERIASERIDGVTQGDAKRSGLEGFGGHEHDRPGRPEPDRSIAAADGCHMGNAPSHGRQQGEPAASIKGHRNKPAPAHGRNGSFWAGAEWITCHDSKARRTEPSIRLLVDGMAGRIGLWRLAGNSISPVLAAEVLEALKVPA